MDKNDLVFTLLDALKAVLPLAEAYLAKAPEHPDNAKLEDARAAIRQAKDRLSRAELMKGAQS